MIISSEFKRNVLTLATGTATAQTINIAILPVLTRLYSKTDFGIFTVYLSIVSIVAVLSTGRYEFAILSAQEEEEAWSTVWLIGYISLATALITLVGVEALRFISYSKLGNQFSHLFIVLLSLSLAVSAIYQAVYYWCNRKKQYRSLASNRVFGSIMFAMASGVLGYIGIGGIGLIVGSCLGQLTNMVLLILTILKEENNIKRPSWVSIRKTALRYINFPKFLIPSGFLDRLSSQLHIFILSSLFGMEVVGSLGLYQKVVSVPTQIVGNAISDVFKQRASANLIANKECRVVFDKMATTLFTIGLIPFLILFSLSPLLFKFVFGAQWYKAGEYSQIMSFMFIFGFVVSPASSLIYIAEKQRYDLMLQIFLIIIATLALFTGYKVGNEKTAIAFFVLAYCIKYIIEFFISRKISRGEL